jgi:cell division initiation protein
MPIRPIDVRRKEFRNSFRGYDANQVDDFLDAVADEFERTYTENARLREEVSSLRERLQQFEELEGSIRAALVHAEQAANDLRRTATREAEDVRKSAAREADLTVREAQGRAHQLLAESSTRVERIQESYEALQEAKRGFTNDFRQLLKTYSEVMDSMEISSAREIEASLRERLDTESIAVAREAASQEPEYPGPPTSESEDASQAGVEPSAGVVSDTASAEDDAATLRIEPQANDEATPEQIDSEIAEVEVTDPEIEPSTSEGPTAPATSQNLGTPSEAEEVPPAPEPGSVEEPTLVEKPGQGEEPGPGEEATAVDEGAREEPTLAEERSSQSFFDAEEGGASSQEGGRDSRIFRASRFLRRRE